MNKQIVVVDIIITNDKSQILLTRRSKTEKSYPDVWSIPGGTVELGESLKDALHREIKEELNAQITEYKIFNAYDFVLNDDIYVYAIYFLGKIAGEIALKQDELAEYKWFDINADLLNLDFAFNQKDIIKDFLQAI